MCLSSVYLLDGNQKELLLKNVAMVKQDGDSLIFSDILGIPTTIKGCIEKIDLMENYIYVKKDGRN